MFHIYGKDVGTTIDFRSAGTHEATHPWPEETKVSAGNGVVFQRGTDESYRTLFMEVYPPGASFIRGEGKTFQECEDAAWSRYQDALRCPKTQDGVHRWIPKGYTNGAGFCAHCNTFQSQTFTGEELGQFCDTCGAGTTYHRSKGDDGVQIFLCKEHTPARDTEDALSRLFDMLD